MIWQKQNYFASADVQCTDPPQTNSVLTTHRQHQNSNNMAPSKKILPRIFRQHLLHPGAFSVAVARACFLAVSSALAKARPMAVLAA